MKRSLLPLLTLIAASICSPVPGEDWPQWRGPRRDGQATGLEIPKTWPKELSRGWSIEVGLGHASPVVADGQVFVFTRLEDKEVILALGLTDGKRLWERSYPAPYQTNVYAASHGKGPKSTPVVAGGRVFTLGIGGILSAWDAKTGKQLWQHEFSKQFKKTSPLFGTASSPLVDGELLIANVGGHDSGALAAFDVASGEVKWQWDGDGPGYTSPIVAELGGVRQVVTQSQNACIGVAVTDGKLLWKLPFKTEYDQNIVTPVIADGMVIFSGLGKGTAACRIEESAGAWSPKEVWRNDDVSMYMNSPVLAGNRLVALANKKKGQFVCLDLASGKTLWASEGRAGDNASLVAAGGTILSLSTTGELVVFPAAADEFRPIARYKVAEKPTWAHPALVGNRILVKDQASLTLWTMGK